MNPTLRVHAILHGTTVNGPGVRTAIWVAGCTIGCPGCWNPETWDPARGTAWGPNELAEAIVQGAAPDTQGLTLSGGEPFQQAGAVAEFVQATRKLRPAWDVFVWTGYTLEALLVQYQTNPAIGALLRQIDILVDGPYVAARRVDKKLWCGSDNQTVVPLTHRGRAEVAKATGSPGEFEIQISPGGHVAVTGFPARGIVRGLNLGKDEP